MNANAPRRRRRSVAVSRSVEQKLREGQATALAYMIAATHPEDAKQILAAALLDLSAGNPPGFFLDLREDARWWSRTATPLELAEYVSAGLDRLKDTALHQSLRKRLFVEFWNGFDTATREEFLRRVQGAPGKL